MRYASLVLVDEDEEENSEEDVSDEGGGVGTRPRGETQNQILTQVQTSSATPLSSPVRSGRGSSSSSVVQAQAELNDPSGRSRVQADFSGRSRVQADSSGRSRVQSDSSGRSRVQADSSGRSRVQSEVRTSGVATSLEGDRGRDRGNSTRRSFSSSVSIERVNQREKYEEEDKGGKNSGSAQDLDNRRGTNTDSDAEVSDGREGLRRRLSRQGRSQPSTLI